MALGAAIGNLLQGWDNATIAGIFCLISFSFFALLFCLFSRKIIFRSFCHARDLHADRRYREILESLCFYF